MLRADRIQNMQDILDFFPEVKPSAAVVLEFAHFLPCLGQFLFQVIDTGCQAIVRCQKRTDSLLYDGKTFMNILQRLCPHD